MAESGAIFYRENEKHCQISNQYSTELWGSKEKVLLGKQNFLSLYSYMTNVMKVHECIIKKKNEILNKNKRKLNK